MSSNGKAAARGQRIELVSSVASAEEAAAVVAAVEQFLVDTAPPAREEKPALSGWQAAALREGIAAREMNPMGGPKWQW